MNPEMRAMLETLAKRDCWSDNEDEYFVVDDYAGGNMDDAYYGGCHTGEVQLARVLLQKFGDN